MKLKTKPTQLENVMRVLDAIDGVQYVRASVEAVDKEEGKSIPTEVLMIPPLVFHRTSGKYLFSGPATTPTLPGPNHKPSAD